MRTELHCPHGSDSLDPKNSLISPALIRHFSKHSCRHRISWPVWLTGFCAFVWFLARVIPKPSRAAYPCQRAAAPMASAFVVWLFAILSAKWAMRQQAAYGFRLRSVGALVSTVVLALAVLAGVISSPTDSTQADPNPAHGPIGKAIGIHPGRVVWVHAPDATDWDGYESSGHWWQTNHTDLAVVEDMMSQALRGLTGVPTDEKAWNALFSSFNQRRDRGTRGYQDGEKIAIKINLTTCAARGNGVNLTTYEKKSSLMNTIDNAPQMLLALLRQVVYVAGVSPENISMGDPTGVFPNYLWKPLHDEFPSVKYFDAKGTTGRMPTLHSQVPFYWSTTDAGGKLQDYVPRYFAEADYLINFAILKGHSAGITVCGKNFYGALKRCPDGYVPYIGQQDYYDMHLSLPNGTWSPGLGRFRALVDLMGHDQLGAKTFLYLVDGLYGGYYWDSHPYKWKMAPFGNGNSGDWPSSLLASQDPVAIDSVAYDFLLNEWPSVVTGGGSSPGSLQGGAEDYLHEAAQADGPDSGTMYDPERDGTRMASLGVHEHWNNPFDKQYSRNLGETNGIELLYHRVERSPPSLLLEKAGENSICLSWPASHYGYRLESSTSLGISANWMPATEAPVIFQARNTMTNELSGGARFFRLAK